MGIYIVEYGTMLKPRAPDHIQRTGMIKPDWAEQKAWAMVPRAVTSSGSSWVPWSALQRP